MILHCRLLHTVPFLDEKKKNPNAAEGEELQLMKCLRLHT